MPARGGPPKVEDAQDLDDTMYINEERQVSDGDNVATPPPDIQEPFNTAEPTRTPGAAPHNAGGETVIIVAEPEPEDAAERAQAERLNRGDGTPEEALNFFNAHGFPGLTTLPTYQPASGIWLFPQRLDGAGDGRAVSVYTATFVVQGPATEAGGASGSGGSGGSVGGGSDAAPSPGPGTGPGAGSGAGSGSGSGGGGSGTGGDGAGSGGSDGAGPGDAAPPAQPAPDIADPPKPDPKPQPGWPLPVGVPQPDGRYDIPVGPIYDADGELVDIAQIHFADEQIDTAISQIVDKNNPLLARMVLIQLLPAGYIGRIVERHFVNPLLAAPAQIYMAAKLGRRAAKEVAEGNVAQAIKDEQNAEHLMRQAALAILSALPLGKGAGVAAKAETKLAAVGVDYLGTRALYPVAGKIQPWMLHQEWVTKMTVDHGFKIKGLGEVFVDGVAHKNGLGYIDKAANVVFVETKMASKVDFVLRSTASDMPAATHAAEIFGAQLRKYIALAQKLETGGVRYVITETKVAGKTPVTDALRAWLAKSPDYAKHIQSGFLEVVWHRPPPRGFKGYRYVTP